MRYLSIASVLILLFCCGTAWATTPDVNSLPPTSGILVQPPANNVLSAKVPGLSMWPSRHMMKFSPGMLQKSGSASITPIPIPKPIAAVRPIGPKPPAPVFHYNKTATRRLGLAPRR